MPTEEQLGKMKEHLDIATENLAKMRVELDLAARAGIATPAQEEEYKRLSDSIHRMKIVYRL